MAALFHTGQLGVGVGQGHRGGVDIIAKGLKAGIQLGIGQGFLALLCPDGGRHKAIPLSGKAALEARRNVHGFLGGLDEQGAAAAERVFHQAVTADTAQVGDGSGQRLADGGLHGVAAVAALVQALARGVQHDLTDVLAEHEADLILRARLGQHGGVMELHQPLDHSLFDDALAGRHAGELAVEGRARHRECSIGGEQLLPGDGIHAIEQLVKRGGGVSVEQEHHTLHRAQVEVGGCDHIGPALKGQAAVADTDVLGTDAAQLKVGRGLAPEKAGSDEFKFCGHFGFLSWFCTGPLVPAAAVYGQNRPAPLGAGPLVVLVSAASATATGGVATAAAVVGLVVEIRHFLFALALEAAHHVLKAQVVAAGGCLGLPHTGSSLPGRTAPLTGRASTALTAAKPAAAIAAMTALPRAIAIRPWPAILPRRAGSTGFLGQQPLDGKRDLSVRGHVDDLDFDRIAIVQDGCNVLHKLIGHLGNMDHAHAALRQRDKRAKRLHACDTTLENVSYLNCQSSILLFFS